MTEIKISLTEYVMLISIKDWAEELKIAALANDLAKLPELVASLDRVIETYNDLEI